MATSDSVIHLDSPEEGRVLREFFEASGYNLKKLRPLWGHRGNTVILLHQTREPSLEHILVRWFVIGRAVKEETAIAFVPEEILRILVRSGLLVRRGDDLVPTVLLLPFADVLTASDMAAESGSPPADIVIGPNAPAGSLMNFTVRRKVATALDMCCGGGIHAMKLAEHSDTVVASDLNQRAMAFARFNTRLHGVENVEFVRGDGFETVAGRSFDLIVANPPFYLLPATDLLYRDNPGDLDGFVQGLLRQAPLYLNEGGFCQMVFEWAELEGQAWPERLSEWFAETACDVWLLPQYSMTPIEYCEARMRSGGAASADKDLEMIADWSGYYRRHKVAAIHGGVVAMRKRNAAENWIRLEQGPVSIREPFGEIVEMFFHAQDMALETDDVLLASHPRLSPGARLEQISQASEEGWLRPSIALRNGNGVQRSCSVDPQVAGFLSHFNGKRSLHDLLGLLSAQPGVGAERVRSQCLAVVRQLIEQGIVLVDREPGAATPQRHGRASNLVHESAKD